MVHVLFSVGFLVGFRSAVSTVLFFLVGLQLSVLLWPCSSTHFVYCLPGYPRLSIFLRGSNLIYLILNNRDIRDKYALELGNRFETLQEKTEKSTPNDEYENFVNAHLEAAVKCIPTKLKTEYRVPWETLAVREKRALVKTASKNYWKKPTNKNPRKIKMAQYQLAGIYIKEQTEYINNYNRNILSFSVLETIEWIMMNRIISVRPIYLKLFSCVQIKDQYWIR